MTRNVFSDEPGTHPFGISFTRKMAALSPSFCEKPPQFKLDPRLARLLGIHTQTRPVIIQALWQYIKTHKLQDPHEREFVICDKYLQQATPLSDRSTCLWGPDPSIWHQHEFDLYQGKCSFLPRDSRERRKQFCEYCHNSMELLELLPPSGYQPVEETIRNFNRETENLSLCCRGSATESMHSGTHLITQSTWIFLTIDLRKQSRHCAGDFEQCRGVENAPQELRRDGHLHYSL
ncbi:uncharacterized protein LOC134807520 [Pan troglodytes]|uniref:uncharacterized protein LOC134807520 n=1 Tax=Pan troglodytes TaxID=9598 RepID=UPI00301324EC